MALNIKSPKGTKDVTPANIHKWYTVEKIARDVAESFGFKEIRIPTFEETNLFVRSVGETTDVVQKEMFSVIGRETTYTLRPEGTAGTIRAMLQNGLLNEAMPQKVFYILSCFRHENVQKGRYREFHQFGLEMAGSQLPSADAEIISLAQSLLDQLGLKNIELYINSIGCPKCRAKYQEALKSFFETKKDQLCSTCLSRLEKNPMRILDCKSKICSDIAKDAPVILDYLCEECSEHFSKLQEYLTNLGIAFKINPKIVRGLDYYTKTVFEFVSNDIGAQGTVCGGGRYDGLIEQLGGKHTPALGFAMGIERIIDVMENQNCDFLEQRTCDLYIAPMDNSAMNKTMSIAKSLREYGYWVEYDIIGRTFKSQMQYANKIGASFLLVLGENELASGKAKVKNMKTGEQLELDLDDKFPNRFDAICVDNMLGNLDELVKKINK